MSSLSESQLLFLKKLIEPVKGSGTVTRSLSNPTAQALRRRGLVVYQIGFGWAATQRGIEIFQASKKIGSLIMFEVKAALTAGFILGFIVTGLLTYSVGLDSTHKREKLRKACELNLPRTQKCVIAYIPEKVNKHD